MGDLFNRLLTVLTYLKMRTLTDEELARRFVLTRQSTYYAVLYSRHYPTVYKCCLHYLRNGEDAEDLTQELFARLLHRIDSYAGQSSLKTWLLTVTRNYCLMHLRRQGNRRMEYYDPDLLLHLNQIDIADSQEIYFAQLDTALQQLNYADRQLLTDFYQKDKPLRELAGQHQISGSAVKMRIMRARDRLRQAYYQQLTLAD
ncbi:RNA polymerase sigma factor [Spirosoma koreense]